ncbi:MAG TPA: chemotaxis protein CheA [Spirochaetota bacterium]|nr:chemotaxis protein CheA [Spirochaetota bacterium]HRZ25429.1 chemotaxis protein CheA [Spirochaetota bacterium]
MATGDKFDLTEAMGIFFTESREMLETFEGCLLNLEKDFTDEESIHALFRAAHTIKGSSGMFGFEEIERFTHAVENLLDLVRKKELSLGSELISILLDCHDYISQIINLFDGNGEVKLPDGLALKRDMLMEELKKYIEGAKAGQDAAGEARPSPGALEEEESVMSADPGDEFVASPYWHISLRFKQSIFVDGLDPQSFISYLNEIGKIEQVMVLAHDVTAFGDIDPELCYLGFEIVFNAQTTKETIENVFDFLSEDCELRILPPGSNIREYVTLINELPEKPMHIGEILREIGSLTETELRRALSLQEEMFGEKLSPDQYESKKPIGEIMVQEKMVQRPVLDAALEKQKDIKKNEELKKKSIRVDAFKLDNLINLIGELVITGANVKQLAEGSGNSELNEAVSTMSRLIEDVRDSTMNIRMVQIGETFKRYERIVRDLSKERGKNIELVISGGETELDKTLIEKISDPMMHLIRNAVDHGIGTQEERTAQGKPAKGTIYLNSYNETGSIVIEVSDDGNGLNKRKIYAKALEQGLIAEGQTVTDEELFRLIFAPGFSTAEKVTNISGRGVGMDVVKKNIESLRGQIELESVEGEGTTVRIHLPLTLAIIDGFMVQVGKSYYILPLDMVVECNEITEQEIEGKDAGNFMNLRGEVLPFMSLREFFNEESEKATRSNIVVTEYGRKKAGFVVDRPIGEFQTVIKPMGKIFKNLKWASGATILGTGDVAMILDVPMLIQYVQETQGAKKATVQETV